MAKEKELKNFFWAQVEEKKEWCVFRNVTLENGYGVEEIGVRSIIKEEVPIR